MVLEDVWRDAIIPEVCIPDGRWPKLPLCSLHGCEGCGAEGYAADEPAADAEHLGEPPQEPCVWVRIQIMLDAGIFFGFKFF